MLIKCLGGFREVGRNAVLLDTRNEKILMDYGLKVETGETPMPVREADVILLAHPHLDHSGSIPVLFRKFSAPIYSTAATFDQTHLLWKDSIKVARLKGRPQIFDDSNTENAKRNEVRITYGQQFETASAVVDVHDAGHVTGSAMFIVEVEGKRILYTSDFNTIQTRLLNGARVDQLKDIDILIMETTYGSRDHPPRDETEKKLAEIVQNTIANNGIALIPVFAIGRAAEILMVLNAFKSNFPIYLDGMAREATDIATHYPELVRDHRALREAFERAVPLYTDDERRDAIKKPCAIVTTGGALEGGPAAMYMRHLYGRPECSLVFTGFQIPRTAGRYLLDTGRYVADEVDLAVKMAIHSLDFSAHSGRSQLLEFVNKIRPKNVICMQGEYCERFATELKGRFGIEAVAPKTGDVLEV